MTVVTGVACPVDDCERKVSVARRGRSVTRSVGTGVPSTSTSSTLPNDVFEQRDEHIDWRFARLGQRHRHGGHHLVGDRQQRQAGAGAVEELDRDGLEARVGARGLRVRHERDLVPVILVGRVSRQIGVLRKPSNSAWAGPRLDIDFRPWKLLPQSVASDGAGAR